MKKLSNPTLITIKETSLAFYKCFNNQMNLIHRDRQAYILNQDVK